MHKGHNRVISVYFLRCLFVGGPLLVRLEAKLGGACSERSWVSGYRCVVLGMLLVRNWIVNGPILLNMTGTETRAFK